LTQRQEKRKVHPLHTITIKLTKMRTFILIAVILFLIFANFIGITFGESTGVPSLLGDALNKNKK
jgi:hypothetical protein